MSFVFKISKQEAEECLKDMPVMKDKYFTSRVMVINRKQLKAQKEAATIAQKRQKDIKKFQPTPEPEKTDAEKIFIIGGNMETTALEMNKVNDEVQRSKDLLSGVLDDITAIRQLARPEFTKIVTEIRENRMSVEREVSTILNLVNKLKITLGDPTCKEAFAILADFTKTIQSLGQLSENPTISAVVSSLSNSRQ